VRDAEAEPLRIAHISDLHLPMGRPRGSEWTAKAALSVASWYLKRRRLHRPEITTKLLEDIRAHNPDVIAMTGDLVNFGSEAEFRKSADFLKELSASQTLLSLPGNHEMMTRHSGDFMRTHWSGFLDGADGAEFPSLRVFGRCALITLSTAIPTPLGFASGEVSSAQRETLAEMLDQVREQGQVPVVLMHHPPTAITSRRKGLIDGPEVCALFAKAGVSLVLHGHTHRRELSWIDGDRGRIPVVGIAPLGMRPRRHKVPGAWQMVEISSDGSSVTLSERQITPDGTVIGMTPMRLDLPAQNVLR